MATEAGQVSIDRPSAVSPPSLYSRLLAFLRPHWWRMAGTIACNLVAAVLDVFTITLQIPFLNALFDQPQSGFIT